MYNLPRIFKLDPGPSRASLPIALSSGMTLWPYPHETEAQMPNWSPTMRRRETNASWKWIDDLLFIIIDIGLHNSNGD